jgi:hypothetical protein
MTQTFSNDELTWDTMARRELQGQTYIDTQFQEESSHRTASPGTSETNEDTEKNSKDFLKPRIK